MQRVWGDVVTKRRRRTQLLATLGIISTALCAIIWPISCRRNVSVHWGSVVAGIDRGAGYLAIFPKTDQRLRMVVHRTPSGMLGWFPSYRSFSGSFSAIRVPIWVFLSISVAAITIAWRRPRAFRPPRCVECSYNLTGNVSGVCPECGTPVAKGDDGGMGHNLQEN